MTDIFQEFQSWDFPGGWVVKIVLPLQGSNPSWGTKIPHVAKKRIEKRIPGLP